MPERDPRVDPQTLDDLSSARADYRVSRQENGKVKYSIRRRGWRCLMVNTVTLARWRSMHKNSIVVRVSTPEEREEHAVWIAELNRLRAQRTQP